MNTLEVLTLVLVIFAALSYIDDHNNKKKKQPTPSEDKDAIGIGRKGTIDNTDGKSESYPIHFLSRLYTRVLEKSSALFHLSDNQ